MRAGSPGHLTKTRPPTPRDSRPGEHKRGQAEENEDDSSKGARGQVQSASGALPDVQKSTENFERPLHICLPNAAGVSRAQQKQGNANFKIQAWAKNENRVLFLSMWYPVLSAGVSPFWFVGN